MTGGQEGAAGELPVLRGECGGGAEATAAHGVDEVVRRLLPCAELVLNRSWLA